MALRRFNAIPQGIARIAPSSDFSRPGGTPSAVRPFCAMANYVLGPGAARRLKEMMRGRMASGRIDGDAAHVVDDGGFEHPYKLTYAASAGAVDE